MITSPYPPTGPMERLAAAYGCSAVWVGRSERHGGFVAQADAEEVSGGEGERSRSGSRERVVGVEDGEAFGGGRVGSGEDLDLVEQSGRGPESRSDGVECRGVGADERPRVCDRRRAERHP